MHFTVKREKERERRERLARTQERLRQEQLKIENDRAADQQRRDMLAAYEANTYPQKLLRLLALARDLGCD